MARFSLKEKLAHYKAVAQGKKPTKAVSKFTEFQQRAFAEGYVNARNEQNRIYAYKNATPEERKAFKQLMKKRRKENKGK